VLAIEFSDDLGLPMIVEKRKLLFEVDLFHMRSVAERLVASQEPEPQRKLRQGRKLHQRQRVQPGIRPVASACGNRRADSSV
jgi:hypothetical protein